MTSKSDSLNYVLDGLSSELGSVLEAVCSQAQQDPPKPASLKALEEIMRFDEDDKEDVLLGALSILRSMGLVRTDVRDAVRATSREAGFALSSLRRFLSASVTVPDETTNQTV